VKVKTKTSSIFNINLLVPAFSNKYIITYNYFYIVFMNFVLHLVILFVKTHYLYDYLPLSVGKRSGGKRA